MLQEKMGVREGDQKIIKYGYSRENHPQWKGDKASHSAIHHWLSQYLGQPKKCSECKTIKAKRFEWANISGFYKRDFNDYKRLCSKCHLAFDSNSRPRGEKNGASKLTEENVLKIRKLYIYRKYGSIKLSKQFNVSSNTIRMIVLRKRWKHI